MTYDVIIIGAGVTGAFIARELSKYALKTCLVEKEADVAMGTSKANSAIIHAGFDSKPGTLKAKLNVQGNKQMNQVAKELDVPYQQIGSLVLSFSKEDLHKLEALKERGHQWSGVLKSFIRSSSGGWNHTFPQMLMQRYMLLPQGSSVLFP